MLEKLKQGEAYDIVGTHKGFNERFGVRGERSEGGVASLVKRMKRHWLQFGTVSSPAKAQDDEDDEDGDEDGDGDGGEEAKASDEADAEGAEGLLRMMMVLAMAWMWSLRRARTKVALYSENWEFHRILLFVLAFALCGPLARVRWCHA